MTSIANENSNEATTINLNAGEFNDFLRTLTNIKEPCNDVDIRDGFIRQRSNDKTSVFEIDMTPILPGVNIAISDIKRKLDLLKTFSGQDVTLDIIDGEPSYFIFSDAFSSLKIKAPSLQYIDNKYMTTEELSRIFIVDEDELILETELTSMITERIRVITTSFNTDAIQILFSGEEASVKAATQAQDQFASFIKGVPTNVILENCSVFLSTIPFEIDHDSDVSFKMFKDPNQDISSNKFETNLGDINMKIFTRSAIVKDEE